MDATTTTTTGLTADNVRAMRATDEWVSFHYVADQSGEGGPLTTMTLTKRTPDTDGFGEGTAKRVVVLSGFRGTDYGDDDGRHGGAASDNHSRRIVSAYASVSCPSVSMEWATIARFVRAGDRLSFIVVAGNNNDHVRNAGLTHDEYWLHVTRETASGKRTTSVFSIGDLICPPHSITRGIKFAAVDR